MPKPVILFYDPTSVPWGLKLKQYCALQGLRLCPVETGKLGRTVGALAGGAAATPESAPASPIPEPLLVFCHLTEPQFNRLLATLRKEGAGNCLKAILTPINADWSLSTLYRELCRERLSMGGVH
ncbi:MAG: DUF3783 domain-containing protein [Oscillospiraceae bacterium]|nr:DUF3783 domain-containing protein [Oscillospiraceae bacterium]